MTSESWTALMHSEQNPEGPLDEGVNVSHPDEFNRGLIGFLVR